MQVLEYGTENPKILLFLPCTAEPEWVFTESVTLLAQNYHVLQVVYDGHGETGEDFISVEHTIDEITNWLHEHGILTLDSAYGCSLGGACLTRLLALGEVTVKQAIIDGGITPYQMPAPLRRLACLRDFLGFKLLAGSRKLLEAAYPPEKYTLPGHDEERMMFWQVILEGLGLGILLVLICAFGIRKGPVEMVHIYGPEVQQQKKWLFGTVGMAVIAAMLSGIMTLFVH